MPVEHYTAPQLVCDDVLHWAETYSGPPFHAALMDPPYHLSGGFMGAQWDKDGPDAIAFRPETWAALARHLLPGAFVMAFASSRGWHRLACAMEDAGLILHPSIFGWGFGSGFPKATRIDTQLDAAAGAEREIVMSPFASRRVHPNGGTTTGDFAHRNTETLAASPLAQTWAGHRYGGQVLKPALEPVIVAQVPYSGRPVDSIVATGAGALWIDGGRLATGEESPRGSGQRESWRQLESRTDRQPWNGGNVTPSSGRWPSNFALLHLSGCELRGPKAVPGTNIPGPGLRGIGYGGTKERRGVCQNYASPDGTETVQAYACADGCPVAALDGQAGERKAGGSKDCRGQAHGYMGARFSQRDQTYESYADDGPVSRFFFAADWALDVAEHLDKASPVFYCGKASASERHAGLEGRNPHPTLKPLTLLRWLSTLLLPPAAYAPRRLLVPFAGTGSEMIGGILAGWETVVGIEREAKYVALAERRVAWWTGRTPETASPLQAEPSAPPVGSQTQLPLF